MALPRALQTQSGVALQVIDYQVLPQTAKADANGTALVQYGVIDPSYLWRVERLVVQHTSTNGGVAATVYGGSGAPAANDFRDWTPIPAGFKAVAEYPQPMTVLGGSFLSVQATGMNQNDVLTVSAQWALVQRVPAGGS